MLLNVPSAVVVTLFSVVAPVAAYLLYAFVRGFVIEFRRLQEPRSEPRTPDERRSDY